MEGVDSPFGVEKDNFDDKKNKYKKEAELLVAEEEYRSYLDIWTTNPSFVDVNTEFSLGKTFLLLLFTLASVIAVYILSQELNFSIGAGIIFVIIFLFIFRDEFSFMKYICEFAFRGNVSFNPFKNLVFWFDTSEDMQERDTLFISNKKDLTHVAMQIYKVNIIPGNVHSGIIPFIKALGSRHLRVPYSFQVVQKPFIAKLQKDSNTSSQISSRQSRITSVYFSVFYNMHGILTTHKRDKITSNVRKMSNDLKSNLIANFHHYKFILLSDISLLNAVRTFFIRGIPSMKTQKENKTEIEEKEKIEALKISFGQILGILSKIIFFSLVIFVCNFVLFYLNIMSIIIFIIDLGLIIAFFLIWCRELFFMLTKYKLRKERYKVVNPFKDAIFYHNTAYPASLFIHVDKRVLIGMKIVNLQHMYPPLPSLKYDNLGRFFEILNGQHISYSYTLSNYPLTFYDVDRKGKNNLNEEAESDLYKGKSAVKSKLEEEKWISKRSGMWYSFLNLSINSYQFVRSIEDINFSRLEDELIVKRDTLEGAFNSKFQNYFLTDLARRKLHSGLLFSILKNKDFTLNGTLLNYLMQQGSSLAALTVVPDILRRGIETRIGAEFNTPLYLENYIAIGHTYNTEVWEKEVPVGFKRDQLKKLLITNGSFEKRELTAMKIVAELIQIGTPSLVFDFTGNWSKLLSYFKDTGFEEDLLFFKLGSAFTTDPLISDIPYDKNNLEYIEYMLDTFALSFMIENRMIDMFRNTIKKHPDMNLPSLQLELQNQNDWEKNPMNDYLQSLFSNFTENELNMFKKIEGAREIDRIHAFDFVKTKKTVIIDVSAIKDLNKKIFFTFLIISKIIHYTTHSNEYTKKVMIIPGIETFFDSFFLDRRRNKGKINTFLDPLIRKGFALIFLANQIHYLHSHFFTYVNNIVTFQATDKRDTTSLGSLMNLQELSGSGVYSQLRKYTYQINYLRTMKNNDVLIKRDSITQPFPALIDWEELKVSRVLPYNKIIEFMSGQGYNLKNIEQRILEQAEKTIFEMDLGHYIIYLGEIIKFFYIIKKSAGVNNRYKKKLKEELKEFIYPKASKKTNRKENIDKIRDAIFDILVRKRYLIASQAIEASGSEPLQISYYIGEEYKIAFDNYKENKERLQVELNIEIIEEESEQEKKPTLDVVFQEQPRKYIIQENNLKKALAREFSDLNLELFNIFRNINHSKYEEAFKKEHGLIKRFLFNVYRHFYNVDWLRTPNDLRLFAGYLATVQEFPFSKPELINYLEYEYHQVLKLDDLDLQEKAKKIYRYITNFMMKIKNFINEDDFE
ncbi:hypothetical protein LCGC14_0949620 [marine sediment metagenome]|uniref:Uncharacterized protein n=1 Tax=marine sediment metagenome TaxID=412755 RepID=A0A0F9P3U5_9ZZZZ